MADQSAIIDLHNIRFSWPGRSDFALCLDHLSLGRGESLLLLGESGSGKSTLLSLLCGTTIPEQGQISIAGTDITTLSPGQRDRFRAEQIGVIFQQFNLLPFGSVLDNILLPLKFAPGRRRKTGDAPAQARSLCHALGLPPDLLNRKASTLSVGQQQRVAVARALIGHPPLIIADEPTSALDETTQSAFLDLLFQQIHQNDTSLLMVSHDPRMGDRFDRVIHLSDLITKGAP